MRMRNSDKADLVDGLVPAQELSSPIDTTNLAKLDQPNDFQATANFTDVVVVHDSGYGTYASLST